MASYFILITCILLNALIGVVFKLFTKYKIDPLPAITINYFVCFGTAAVVMGKNPIPAGLMQTTWLPYAILMGLLFILIFNLVALTVHHFGVVIGTIFQKMSLVAPTLLGIVFFGESSGWLKWAGIALAILAITLLSLQKKAGAEQQSTKSGLVWLFPLLTFAGSCLIDSGLFLIEHYKLASSSDASFIATLFLTAGFTGMLVQAFRPAKLASLVHKKNVIAGVALGIPNFFSIHLILVALHHGWEGSQLFPINNTGVLLASVAIGTLVFHEKLHWLKIAGIGVAILSILLIAYS
ncbi:MAG: DMT family transporter [Saprospiraceae bacterium]|nr:DMT family transporter [Saprospiraceae bacterium]